MPPKLNQLVFRYNDDYILIGDISKTLKKCKKCKTNPFFGPSDSKEPIFCKTHKGKNDINVIYALCPISGCPHYARKQFNGVCRNHYITTNPTEPIDKTQNIVIGDLSMVPEKCLHCDVRPYFGKKGSGEPIYCFTHKGQTDTNLIYQSCPNCEKNGKKKYNGYCQEHFESLE